MYVSPDDLSAFAWSAPMRDLAAKISFITTVASLPTNIFSAAAYLVSAEKLGCAPSEGGCGGRRFKQDINDPKSLTGATPEELRAAAAKAGYEPAGPTNDPSGERLRVPGNVAKQIRIMLGKASRSDPMKRGHYAIISNGGSKITIPLGEIQS